MGISVLRHLLDYKCYNHLFVFSHIARPGGREMAYGDSYNEIIQSITDAEAVLFTHREIIINHLHSLKDRTVWFNTKQGLKQGCLEEIRTRGRHPPVLVVTDLQGKHHTFCVSRLQKK